MGRLADLIVIPACLVWLAFEPNYLHGWVVYVDEGQNLAPIMRLFHGEVPYRDSYTLYGPLFLYLPALLMMLFGKTIAVLRAYFHVSSILNLLVAYLLGRRLCRTRVFRYLVPLLLLIETTDPFWSSRWGGLRPGIELLGLYCLTRYVQGGTRRDLALAGLLTGVGLLYSTNSGVLLGLVTCGLAVWLYVAEGRSVKALLRDLRTYGLGITSVVLPVAIYLASQGALMAYLKTAFWLMPLGHHRLAPPEAPSLLWAYRQSPNLLAFVSGQIFKIYLPLVLYEGLLMSLLVNVFRGRVRRDDSVIVLLTSYGLLSYYLAFRAIYGPQFQMAMVPLILLSAWALERCASLCLETFKELRFPTRGTITTLILSVAILAASAGYVVASWKPYFGTLGRWCWYQQHKSALTPLEDGPRWLAEEDWAPLTCSRGGGIRVPKVQAEEIDGVTQFLSEQATSDEQVFTFPEHGIFNFFADRLGVSRFDVTAFAIAAPEWRREVLEDLRQQRPRFVVKGRFRSRLAGYIGLHEEMLPEVGSFLRAHYRLVRRFPSVEILELQRTIR